MAGNIKYLILISFLLAFFSCDNELDINMDIDGVPVIYCVLDMDDTSQVVRLAKSFFPEEDYWKYDQLEIERWDEPVDIYIEEWTNSTSPNIYDFSRLNRVRQDSGYFVTPSFELFEAIFTPVPNTEYILYLYFPEREYYAYARTFTVGHPDIIDPAYIPGRGVTFSDLDDYIVQFRPSSNSEFHQYSFILKIEEHRGNEFNVDYFDFGSTVYESNTDQIITNKLSSARFYRDLTARYDELGDGDYRKVSSLEFIIYSFGREMRLYNQLYNNGTQPWEIQTYTSFVNGMGVFSSVAHDRLTNLQLSRLTLDILTQDPRYENLRFIR
jgi:hypothetical protein